MTNDMFYLIKGYKAFALTGRFPTRLFTQGDALGWYLAGLSGRFLQLPPYGQWGYDKSLNFLI